MENQRTISGKRNGAAKNDGEDQAKDWVVGMSNTKIKRRWKTVRYRKQQKLKNGTWIDVKQSKSLSIIRAHKPDLIWDKSEMPQYRILKMSCVWQEIELR